MVSSAWTPRALPGQHGKTFVVTGGSSGIGYFIVEQLAATGARVVMASRSQERMDAAAAAIRADNPGARLETIPLDLASLDSVARAAEGILALGGIDGLVGNAGITDLPRERGTTSDGFELLVGTNYLGHFALTARSFAALRPGARVVTLGSIAPSLSTARPDDLLSEKHYTGFRAYATSKHATTAFAIELDRRLRAAGLPLAALVAHPGYCIDATSERRAGINDLTGPERFFGSLLAPFTQGRDRGAWPVVRALLDPTARGGQFYGPMFTLFGSPRPARTDRQDRDLLFAAQLWQRSEQWTGVRFDPRDYPGSGIAPAA